MYEKVIFFGNKLSIIFLFSKTESINYYDRDKDIKYV